MRTCPNCGHSIRDDDRFCASCGAPAQGDGRRQPVLNASEERPRRLTGGSASLSPYVRALRRFWWVLVVGAGVALIVAVSSLYRIELAPPGLVEKTQITYTSSSRLLVTSQENSHLRYQTSIFADPPRRQDQAEEDADPIVVNVVPPDVNTLVRAANLYPILIESDQVAEFRNQEYGPLEGSVTATGIYSVTAGNRVELSEIPVIQLVATASTAEGAVEIADKTAKAFIGWMRREQNADNLPPQDRILVQQLDTPAGAIPSEGASRTMPLLIFCVVFGAFCVLAVLLDRLVAPRPRPLRADVEALERPVEVKKSA